MSADKQLKAYIDRVLRLKEEQDTIGDDIRDVYAEAARNGIDKITLFLHVRDVAQKREGYSIYFAAFHAAGLLKIGISQNVNRRMAQLALMRGEPAELLFEIQEATRVAEGWAHAEFSEWRVHREWFRLCPATLQKIELLKAQHQLKVA